MIGCYRINYPFGLLYGLARHMDNYLNSVHTQYF